MFPPDNPWNRDVSGDPVDPDSAGYIRSMNGGSRFLHPDFGSDPGYGIPWTTVQGTQPRVPMSFDYADESDPGPYPFPPDAPMEAGSDHHVFLADNGSDWFVTGETNPAWDDDDLAQLKTVPADAFEVVRLGPVFR